VVNMLHIQIFTLIFSLYTFISLIICFTVANTALAWLIYLFSLLPVYIICAAYFVFVSFKHFQKKIRFRKILLLPVLTAQILMILSSPANCYGWNQGRSCYSFIQAYLSHEDLHVIQGGPAHWAIAESTFPLFLLLNLAAIVAFSATTKIEKA